MTEGYTEAEQKTWPTQQTEVEAWALDPSAPTPYLDGLAAERGITAQDMRARTLAQTQLFKEASKVLLGKAQRLRDLVHESQTPEELESIQWDGPMAAG